MFVCLCLLAQNRIRKLAS